MNVKKYFCCVPIINVRQSVTVSHDKSTQHNGLLQEGPGDGGGGGKRGKHEVYKNITFKDHEQDDFMKEHEATLYSALDFRRGSNFSQASSISNGKPKSLRFTDITPTTDNLSTGSSNHSGNGKPKNHTIDTSSVIEAHGLLTSLLLENDLPQHVADTLKRVAKILDPSPTTGTPMLARMWSRANQFGMKTDSDPSSDCEDETDEDGKGNWRQRYNGPSKRRLKVSVWSTVTSATGLPTLVPEPTTNILKKSSVDRKPSSSKNFKSSLDVTEADIRGNDEASYVTPWDRRLSKAVTYKRNPKNSSCSLVTEEQKTYLMRSLSDEYECTSEYLDQVNSWSFPIFKFNDSTQHCLSLMSFHIFSKIGLIDHFRINPVYFRNYFETIESGYHNLPYHNAIHAADVLQACYYLCSSSIPGFNNNQDDSGSSIDSDTDLQSGSRHVDQCNFTFGSLKDILTELELLALFTAAAIHDYDHPGRTNAFLVAVGDTKAVMYNDRAVLESHHVASAWYLLVSDERYNFCSGLSTAEFKRFRFLLIEAVLATDLKKHFDFLAQLNAKTVDGEGMDWSNAEDRILALQMCIKLADINAPCKDFELHIQWTKRIVEEFYQQGDNEAKLGMPVSAYMNRNKDEPRVPELQVNFIKHLVAPLYHAMASSCLVPGSWDEIMEEEEEEDMRSSNSDLNSAKPFIMPHTHKFVSQLQKNLDSNYGLWKTKNEAYQASLKTNGLDGGTICEEEVEEEAQETRTKSEE